MRHAERNNQYRNKKIMTTTKNIGTFKDHPKVKNLGIWMDHANAHLTEFITDPITTEIISNKAAHREKELSPGKNEDGMHHQAHQEQAQYYQKLCNIIRNFQDVLLFGPTGAKLELLNLLRSDHQFEHIKLDIKDSDRMSQNKQHAFVRDHFSHR
jgi:hypothetical protein